MTLHQKVSESMLERIAVAVRDAFNELSKMPEVSAELSATTIVSTLNHQSIVLVDWLDSERVQFKSDNEVAAEQISDALPEGIDIVAKED